MKTNIVNFIQILRELNYILNRQQKKKAIGVIIIIIISSFFELLGVAMILPFIQVIMTPEKIMENAIVAHIMRIVGISSATELLIMIGVALILLYLLKNAFLLFSLFIQNDYSSRVQEELSNTMLQSYMNRPYEYFLDTNSAIVSRGCGSDVGGVYTILSQMMSLLTESLTIVMIGIYLVYADPIIAGSIFVIMLLVLIGIIMIFKPVMKKMGKKYREVTVVRSKILYQAVHGIKEIFVMRRTNCFMTAYEEASVQLRKTQRTQATIAASPERIIEGICVSAIIGVVCVRLLMPGTNMAALVPTLGSFAMAAFKVFPSVGKVASRITTIVYQRLALSSIYNNMKEANAYMAQRQEYLERSGGLRRKEETIEFKEKLVIQNVGWKYKNQKKSVLSNVCMKIRKGESIAFIGSSGSGKTTLSDIILGLLHPRQGAILMDDNIDVYSILDEWGHIVGYVPQSVFLLDDTVRNNILFGLPKEQVNDALIWESLEQAQIKEFIESLPEGLDTIVGERGIKFSGGQKQRIALARALYNKPEILVLDEATAALDGETEKAVMDSISALQGKITMIIVAHRLTTIRDCDKIYRIENGIATEVRKEEIFG